MPGGVPNRRPLPIDPGWTVEVRCPHGTLVRGALDMLRSNQRLDDPCAVAVAARKIELEARDARLEASEVHQWWVGVKHNRAARTFRRQMRRGVPWRSRSDIDPNGD